AARLRRAQGGRDGGGSRASRVYARPPRALQSAPYRHVFGRAAKNRHRKNSEIRAAWRPRGDRAAITRAVQNSNATKRNLPSHCRAGHLIFSILFGDRGANCRVRLQNSWASLLQNVGLARREVGVETPP